LEIPLGRKGVGELGEGESEGGGMDGWRERTREVVECIVKGRDENGREAKEKSSPLLCMDVWMECALSGLYALCGFNWMQMGSMAWHRWTDEREGQCKIVGTRQRTNY